MGYLKSRKYTGGMNNSKGYSQQDYASVKFIFDYLDNGLREISFETLNDFCIVFEEKEKIYFQSKIEQFTLANIAEWLSDENIREKTVFIGSGYDDPVRILLDTKERYLAAYESELHDDKKRLFEEMDEVCKKTKIDIQKFLCCDFIPFDYMHREAIAKNSISTWADSKGIFIDTEQLLFELVALIYGLRTFGGHLSKKDIEAIVKKHRTSKIESFLEKKNRISLVVEDYYMTGICEELDKLAKENQRLEETILLIKYNLMDQQLPEARNRIENIISMCPRLKGILLMILNIMGDYDAVLEYEKFGQNDELDCIVEYAKAFTQKKDYYKALEYLETIDKENREEIICYLSAINHWGIGNEELAREELEECIKFNDKFIEAYVDLAMLIYKEEGVRATEYLDIVLNMDPKYAKAYLVRAEISKMSDDFENVINNYEKYIMYSGDDENEGVLLDLAINKYHMETDDWGLTLKKWNEVFRKKQNVNEEISILVIDFGVTYLYEYLLNSMEDGLDMFLDGEKIFSYRNSKHMSKTMIGLYVPPIDAQMMNCVLQNNKNPIRKSTKAIYDKVAVPMIAKIYEDYEAYQETLEQLFEQRVLHINHIFDENYKEYIVSASDISVKMMISEKKLTGTILIGQIGLNMEINPRTNSLDTFIELLNKDCGFNEAVVFLVCGEKYKTQLTFPKDKIEVIEIS